MPKDNDLTNTFSIPIGITGIDHLFGEFIKLTAVIDHYITLFILFHFFGSEAMKENKGVVNDFSKWFLSNQQESMSFEKKVVLVDKIINNIKYNHLPEKYRSIFNSSYLEKIIIHRNLLINSHYILSQQEEDADSIKLVVLNNETLGNNYTKELDLNLHKARLQQAKETRKELINLARDLGFM